MTVRGRPSLCQHSGGNSAWSPDRASAQVFPCDEVFLTFELKGIKSNEGGVTKIKLTTEVMGKDGKTEYKQDTGDSQVLDLFGGGRRYSMDHKL